MKTKMNRTAGLFSFALALLCITINSKFSFLYAFHDADDVHCFITVARCMLRGDVLYRDIYEHKGPMHYFLYSIGLAGNNESLLGLWIIEFLLYALFLYFVYKTVELFFENRVLQFLIVAAIGVWATKSRSFCAGGQCEELTLPFVMISIYLSLKQFEICKDKSELDAKSNKKQYLDSLFIGISLAIVFWSKYTITGVFIGYALAVLIVGIVKKEVKYILKCAGEVVAGFLIGSLPVILYFSANRAFSDLWEVYFYNLLFKYSQTNESKTDFWSNIKSLMGPWVWISLFGVIIATKAKIKTESKIFILLMTVFSMIGLSAGKTWGYVYEAVFPFAVFLPIGISGIFSRIMSFDRIKAFMGNCVQGIKDQLNKELNERYKGMQRIVEKLKSRRALVFKIFVPVLLLYSLYFSFVTSVYADEIGKKPEEYEKVKIAKIITENGPDDPQILCFTALDPGLYYLTDTYPPDKYFCKYNLFSIEELKYYEKYIETGMADYVFSYKPIDKLADFGYELEYTALGVSTVYSIGSYDYYLYAKVAKQ